MAKPKQVIELKNNEGVLRSFDFQHALRLLVHESGTGKKNWHIAEKGFEFKNNEIISTGNSRDSKES